MDKEVASYKYGALEGDFYETQLTSLFQHAISTYLLLNKYHN
jgi:hypothetical protein